MKNHPDCHCPIPLSSQRVGKAIVSLNWAHNAIFVCWIDLLYVLKYKMESTALLSSLNLIVPWLFQRVIGIFSYLRKEANIGLKMEAKATATRGIFRTSTIFGFKLGEWKTPFWYPDWESRYCLGWGRSYGIGKGMEIQKLFRFSLQMAHVTLLSCLGQSKSMTKPVAMSALHCYPRGQKGPREGHAHSILSHSRSQRPSGSLSHHKFGETASSLPVPTTQNATVYDSFLYTLWGAQRQEYKDSQHNGNAN